MFKQQVSNNPKAIAVEEEKDFFSYEKIDYISTSIANEIHFF